jgi:hypothetical protein
MRSDDLELWRRSSEERERRVARAKQERESQERRDRERTAATITADQVQAMITAAIEDERNFLWAVIGPALRQLLDEEREEMQQALDSRAKVAEIDLLKAEIAALRSAPAPVRLARAWSADGVSYMGDVVTHAGSLFQAVRDTGREPPHVDDWVCLAAAGRDANTPQVKGVWSPDTPYCALSIVVLNGGSFIARRDNPGQCPGEGWQMIARQGQRGVAGEKGERGLKGDQGPPGQAIKSWVVDSARYVATPIMSDGNRGPELELRALFRQFQQDTA